MSTSELSSIVTYCLLCTNPVQLQTEVEEDLSPNTPNPGSSASAGSSSSSPSPPAKLISHEQCSFVLFRHVLGRDLPPNIDNQIALCKNDSQIKYCNPCLTQLTHIHDLVAQLARLERELAKQRSEIALKFCKVSPPNPATSATAAVGLPQNERQEFMELRDAIFGGLELVTPQSILAIVGSLKKCHRKRPTLPPAHAQLDFPTRFDTSNSNSSSVRLMKNVSIRRIVLRTRRAQNRGNASVMKSPIPAKTRLNNSFPTDPLAEDIIRNADDPSPVVSLEKNWLSSDSDSAFCVGVKVEGAELEEPAPNSTGGVQMAYLCGECGAIFKDRYSLNHHDDEAHRHHDDDDDARNLLAGSSVRSPPADATFALPTSTATTTATTTTSRRQRCKQNLAVQSKQLQQRKHKCTLCPAKFTQARSVQRHLFVHTGERPFPCSLCPAKFSEARNLKRHLMVHTGDKPFPCTLCPAKFSQAHHLKKHVEVHARNAVKKQFYELKCPSCSKTFGAKHELKAHSRSRGGDTCQLILKNYKCTLCPAKFIKKEHLKRHLLGHSGVKQFECTLCPAKFTQAGSVQRHLLVHTGERPFPCTLCPAKFSEARNLKRHLLVHTGDKPFPCTLCPAKFSLAHHLKKHVEVHARAAPLEQHHEPPIGAQPNCLDKQIPFIESEPNPTPSGTTQPANATAVSPTTESESESCGIVILEEKFVPDFNIQAQI